MALPQTMKEGGTDIERILAYSMDSHHLINPAGGHIFFVDGVSGDDNNLATDPTCPKLTVKDVLADCVVTNRKDWVIVLDYPYGGGVTGEDEPIVVNKNWVTIMGIGNKGDHEPLFTPSGDTDMFSIQANYVTLKNLYIAGGATSAAIVAGVVSCHSLAVIDCNIGLFDAQAYGIEVAGGNSLAHLWVENCRFGRNDSDHFTYAIYLGGNATSARIQNNVFTGASGPLIFNDIGLGPDCQILNNIFVLRADTKGEAITLDSLSSNNVIDGNHAFFGKDAIGTNPYIDDAGADANHWGLNYMSITATMPTTT